MLRVVTEGSTRAVAVRLLGSRIIGPKTEA